MALSQLMNPAAYRWSDSEWTGLCPKGQVIYEMHVGTFTQEGSWKAAARQLPELADLGISALEVMPVAEFYGRFGWGYDGVCLFAPTHLYGTPDEFRHFVDEAHRHHLGVILDVVYNHFGSVGNTLGRFSNHYRSTRYDCEWGDAVNFDDQGSRSVREFFVTNARYWIDEFHLDGLRFDATQSIQDSSSPHILVELARAARSAAERRKILLISENEPQDVRMLRPPEDGGYGMDAVWDDDFHHAAAVRLTGRNEAYYSEYLGRPEEFLAVMRGGFIYQGQHSQWQGKPRGTSTRGFPPESFVVYLQNHDQVANSIRGDRIDRISSPGMLRAMTALWLLSPQTPLFFQGQEYSASRPFLYFADNEAEQARRVIDGRSRFLEQFPSIKSALQRSHIPDPAHPPIYERCRLECGERHSHRAAYALHRDLLRLRREDPVFRRQDADQIAGAAVGGDALVVRYFGPDGDDRLLAANFGPDLKVCPVSEPLFAPDTKGPWELLWSSEQLEYGGAGVPPVERADGWHLPGQAAIVFRTASPP